MLKILRCSVLISLCILIMSLFLQSANAASTIESINVPMVAAKFDTDTMIYRMSGLSTVQVSHNNSSAPTTYSALFALNTYGLDFWVDGSGNTIDYCAGTATGKIDIISEEDRTHLLSADLLELEMYANKGVFSGEGSLEVTGGDLMGDFVGNSGGLVTIEINYKSPYDFSMPFAAMANASFSPKEKASGNASSIPEPSIMFLLGSLIIFVGWLEKKKRREGL